MTEQTTSEGRRNDKARASWERPDAGAEERCFVGSKTEHPCERIAGELGMCAEHIEESDLCACIDEATAAAEWFEVWLQQAELLENETLVEGVGRMRGETELRAKALRRDVYGLWEGHPVDLKRALEQGYAEGETA